MKLEFRCPDIQCDGCANSIRNTLGSMPEVRSVEVDVASKLVTVEAEDGAAEAVRSRLDEIGFPPAG